MLRTLYKVWIEAKVDYGLAAWGTAAPKEAVERLEVLERVALRRVTGCTPDTRVPIVYKEAECLPLSARIKAAAA
eukprot:gene9134-571_t